MIGVETWQLASPAEASRCIFGFCCVNDVTARELQARDVQFTRAKGFDTFCPVGPCIATDLDTGDWPFGRASTASCARMAAPRR